MHYLSRVCAAKGRQGRARELPGQPGAPGCPPGGVNCDLEINSPSCVFVAYVVN